MTVKQFLKQGFVLDKIINAKKTRIGYLQDQLEWLGSLPTLAKVRKSGSKDRLGDTIAVLLDAIAEVEKEIKKLANLQQSIADVIAQVEQTNLYLVLYERYVNLKRWEDIAYDLSYSTDNIFKLHGRGLQELEKSTVNYSNLSAILVK